MMNDSATIRPGDVVCLKSIGKHGKKLNVRMLNVRHHVNTTTWTLVTRTKHKKEMVLSRKNLCSLVEFEVAEIEHTSRAATIVWLTDQNGDLKQKEKAGTDSRSKAGRAAADVLLATPPTSSAGVLSRIILFRKKTGNGAGSAHAQAEVTSEEVIAAGTLVGFV